MAGREAEQLSSLGGENSTSSDVSLINIQKKGNAGFYYGEARHVFEQGYIISTHLRGYYSSGDEVISHLQKSFMCMGAAIGANPAPEEIEWHHAAEALPSRHFIP